MSMPEALQFTESLKAYQWSGAFDKELQRMSLRGLLNRAINAFELHIPEYQFYSPGMRLEKRLTRDN